MKKWRSVVCCLISLASLLLMLFAHPAVAQVPEPPYCDISDSTMAYAAGFTSCPPAGIPKARCSLDSYC